MVELLVWLLYGYEAVQRFRDATPEFWERTTGTTDYYVSSYVNAFLDIMAEDIGKKNIYWSLLSLLRTRALVVAVSDEYKSSLSHREIAAGLPAKMVEIQNSFDDSYKKLPELEYPDDRVIRSKNKYFRPDREGGKLSAGAPKAEARLSTNSPDQPAPSANPEGVRIVVSSPTNQLDSHLKPEADKKQEVSRGSLLFVS